MSALEAFAQGANCVAFTKDGKTYAAIYAWATMIGYDEVAILQGDQSETGRALAIGDVVGISALASNQEAIAVHVGNTHSSEVDKLARIPHETKGTAILLAGAKVRMIAEVIDIVHLKGAESDNFIVYRVLEHSENPEMDYLSAYFAD